MRERILRRRQRLQIALVSALIIGSGLTAAFAQNAQKEDDDEWIDVKIFRGVMKELGFQRDEAPIDYRERSPLVVPPSRSLPSPRAETPARANPAWPNDPDIKRRQQEATATVTERARLRGDAAMESMRPLRPDELERGRSSSSSPRGAGDNSSAETADRPMKPSELGNNTSLWDKMFSAVGPERAESRPFAGEDPRTVLTSPPTGYQTPSPGQPYGTAPADERSGKAATSLDDRLIPTR